MKNRELPPQITQFVSFLGMNNNKNATTHKIIAIVIRIVNIDGAEFINSKEDSLLISERPIDPDESNIQNMDAPIYVTIPPTNIAAPITMIIIGIFSVFIIYTIFIARTSYAILNIDVKTVNIIFIQIIFPKESNKHIEGVRNQDFSLMHPSPSSLVKDLYNTLTIENEHRQLTSSIWAG